MNYIAATLMKYTTPENSLMIMASLFQFYGVKSWYDRDFTGLRKEFYTLLRLQKKYMPALYKKLKDFNYVPSMYAQPWFLTLFAGFFSLELVSRIWDIFLVEGKKTIFRIALAILKLNENALLKADECRIYTVLSDW